MSRQKKFAPHRAHWLDDRAPLVGDLQRGLEHEVGVFGVRVVEVQALERVDVGLGRGRVGAMLEPPAEVRRRRGETVFVVAAQALRKNRSSEVLQEIGFVICTFRFGSQYFPPYKFWIRSEDVKS